MAESVVMPKAGISVESCIIGTWRKNIGDNVAVGEVLFDYETDKASFECESTAGGILLDIFFEDGDEVECLTSVCAIGAAGEDVSSLRPNGAVSSVAESDASVGDARSDVTQPVSIISEDSGTSIIDKRTSGAPSPTSMATGAVSPRARNLAARMKVDINSATASGPRGRVIERDIIAAANSAGFGDNIGGRNADGSMGGGKVGLAAAMPEYTDEKMSPIRKAISKSMTKSLTEIAQLTHQHSCDATVMLGLRARFKRDFSDTDFGAVSLNDMILFAVAKTLKAHPDMNAHLNGDTLRKFSGIHLGVAVDTPRGLLVPTVFNVDKMSLVELSEAVKSLAGQAKDGNISPDLLQGASFTVSNLGALGVEMFTPVINPPQVGILGVCGISPKVREVNGKIEVYQSLGLSITYDHRAIDGAPASRFASDLARNIENIDVLMMGGLD